jgi:transposase
VLGVEDWAEIRRLHRGEGMPIKAVARVMGVSKNTVKRALAADGPPRYERTPRGSIVDAVELRIRELLQAWPRMPATVIAERIGWTRSLTVLKDRVRELRPVYLPPDPASRTAYAAGEVAQCDLWFPDITLPVGFGQTRSASRLPVLVMVTGYARWLAARLLPSRVAEDLFAGWWQLLAQLGAVPRVLVWDGESAVGQRRRRQTVLTQGSVACWAPRSWSATRGIRRPRDWWSGPTGIWRPRSCPAEALLHPPISTPSWPTGSPCPQEPGGVRLRPRRTLKREVIAHLGTLDFVVAKENVVFLGPPGTGKTHLAIGLGIRACQAGHRVLFATAAQWVARLADAHAQGRLQAELVRLGRYPLLVVDEVGYIPFEAEAANLFFQLVSARYERASLIVTSNKPFGRWGEVFGDDVVAAAMIDRLVHHAEVVALKGDSYRLKDRDLGRVPAATTDEQ